MYRPRVLLYLQLSLSELPLTSSDSTMDPMQPPSYYTSQSLDGIMNDISGTSQGMYFIYSGMALVGCLFFFFGSYRKFKVSSFTKVAAYLGLIDVISLAGMV